jgi:spore germination cell wall hydrolase CwlJ-like protein
MMPKDIGRFPLRHFHTVLTLAVSAGLFAGAASATAAARPVPEQQKNCLATAIYFEARGESERGQKGVAQVILNRVENNAYPDTICDVVYQNKEKRNACQFSFACDGRADRASEPKAWKRALSLAEEVLDGENLVQQIRTATHYHADYVKPYWAPKMKRLSKIGRHIFYRI